MDNLFVCFTSGEEGLREVGGVGHPGGCKFGAPEWSKE